MYREIYYINFFFYKDVCFNNGNESRSIFELYKHGKLKIIRKNNL